MSAKPYAEYTTIANDLNGEPAVVMPLSQTSIKALKAVNDSEAVSIARLGVMEFFMSTPAFAVAAFSQISYASVRRSIMNERIDFSDVDTRPLASNSAHLVTEDGTQMQDMWDSSTEIARLALPGMLPDWHDRGPHYDLDAEPNEVGGRLADFEAAIEYWNSQMYAHVKHVADDRYKDVIDQYNLRILLHLQHSMSCHRIVQNVTDPDVIDDYSMLVHCRLDEMLNGLRADTLQIALNEEGVVQDRVDDETIHDILAAFESFLGEQP